MPYNGSGTFTRVHSWVTDRANSVKITASRMDAEHNGFATGLSNALLKDGQQVNGANQNWGGYRLTNLGNATSDTDALNRVTADGRYLQRAEVEQTAASASSIDVSADGHRWHVTGTTTIATITAGANRTKRLRFSDNLTITHNATSLICPGGDDLQVAAGDIVSIETDGSSNVRVVAVYDASTDPDEAVVTSTATQTLSNKTLVMPTIVDGSTNELLGFAEVASAVNSVQLTNAATGGGPLIEAIGDDTNVDLRLKAKGTGDIQLESALDLAGVALKSDGATLAKVHRIFINTDTSTYTTTTTTTLGANGSAPSQITPTNSNTSLLVIASCQISCDKTGAAGFDIAAIANLGYYDGAAYASFGQNRTIMTTNYDATGTAILRGVFTDAIILTQSELRSDTSVWLPRILFHSVYTGTTVDMSNATFLMVEVE